MPDAGEQAYAFAKASGIIGKSFVGKHTSRLADLKSVNELDRLVFPDLHRELPGQELLTDLEGRILKRAVKHILLVLNSYENPPELLVRQLRSYEYGDLKTCLNCISGGIKSLPAVSDLGRFRTVNFSAFPDLGAMLKGTEFDFIRAADIKAVQGGGDLTAVETELDRRYYLSLKESLKALSAGDRAYAERILAEEISLRNCVWALRLRTYFGKTSLETRKYLMDITMRVGLEGIPGGIRKGYKSDARTRELVLAAEAVESLDLPLDSRSPWQGWRWERLLNPEKSGGLWKVDPRYFQNAASEYLYRLALRCFRAAPFAVSSVFCYIKLKQFEEGLLTSIAEGLGLGMSAGKEVFDLLEVSL